MDSQIIARKKVFKCSKCFNSILSAFVLMYSKEKAQGSLKKKEKKKNLNAKIT